MTGPNIIPASPKAEDAVPVGIAAMTPGQLLDVIDILSGQARSHGSSYERASGVAHAALDICVVWLEAHR